MEIFYVTTMHIKNFFPSSNGKMVSFFYELTSIYFNNTLRIKEEVLGGFTNGTF